MVNENIVVTIIGGCVQGVDGAPKGTLVEIRDYDDGAECENNSDYIEGKDWFRDEEGVAYQRSLWKDSESVDG